MKIKQIGNGGAFDWNKTNSSFLIDIGTGYIPEYILFDCGYNVFEKLRKMEEFDKEEIIKNIKYVYISHMDDDHMGSLKTLGYYRYFVLGETTKIIANPGYKELVQYLKGINSKLEFGEKTPADIFEFTSTINDSYDENYYFEFVKGTHHTETYGLVLAQVSYLSGSDSGPGPKKYYLYNAIFISADTKVNKNTLKWINIFKEAGNKYVTDENTHKNINNYIKVFHDYSNWDNYDQQTHTCKYDFEKYYGSILKDHENDKRKLEIRKYHNGEDFLCTWEELKVKSNLIPLPSNYKDNLFKLSIAKLDEINNKLY